MNRAKTTNHLVSTPSKHTKEDGISIRSSQPIKHISQGIYSNSLVPKSGESRTLTILDWNHPLILSDQRTTANARLDSTF